MKLSELVRAQEDVRRAQRSLAELDDAVNIEIGILTEEDNHWYGDLDETDDADLIATIFAALRARSEKQLAAATATLNGHGIEVDSLPPRAENEPSAVERAA